MLSQQQQHVLLQPESPGHVRKGQNRTQDRRWHALWTSTHRLMGSIPNDADMEGSWRGGRLHFSSLPHKGPEGKGAVGSETQQSLGQLLHGSPVDVVR